MPDAQTLLIVSEETSFRNSGLDLSLSGGDLALPGLENLTHDHVLDLVGRDVGALQRGADGVGAELGGVEGGQTSAELSDRRPGA